MLDPQKRKKKKKRPKSASRSPKIRSISSRVASSARKENRGPTKKSYHPKGWPGIDDNFQVSDATNSVPVLRVDNRPADEVSPLKRILSKISTQIDHARGADGEEVNFDTMAENFDMLRKINATEEQTLQEDIQTQTMHNMVQSVTLGNEGRRSNLMFLPNKQARMLTQSESHVDKIFAAFDVKEPKLIINLLHDTNGVFENGLDEYVPRDVVPPSTAWGTAFETEQKANEAFFRLVRFMMEVVVPLAVETNALILCSASESILSRALLQALENTHSTVIDHITILGFAAQLRDWMESESNENRTGKFMIWREACNQSPNWRVRQATIDEVWSQILDRDPVDGCFYRQDLLPGLENVIVFDTFNQTDKTCQLEPFIEFKNKFCKTLFSRYGCVSFKTGRHNNGQASIGQCFDVLKSNSPVFLLDCFERPDVVEWKDAKSHHAKQPRVVRLSERRFAALWGDAGDINSCQEKLENLLAEYPLLEVDPSDPTPFMIPTEDLPVDFLAYASKLCRKNLEKVVQVTKRESLYQAIQRMRKDLEESSESPSAYYEKARQNHISKMKRFIFWYLESFDALASRWGGKIMTPKWEVMKAQFRVQAEALLVDPNVFGVNVTDITEAKRLLKDRTPLDRLPESSLEGLELLKDCWNEVDVATHASKRYKLISQLLHLAFLGLTVIIMILVCIQIRVDAIIAVERYNLTSDDLSETKLVYLWPSEWPEDTEDVLYYIIFALTLLTILVFCLMTYINPRARWRYLRAHASSLQSIIWGYRTRTGLFATPERQITSQSDDASSVDHVLRSALMKWRETVIKSGYSSMTAYQRSSSKFVHGQTATAPILGNIGGKRPFNDHFSAATPNVYLHSRLNAKISFFQSRLPRYKLWRNLFCVILLFMMAANSTFAYWGDGLYVAMISSFAIAFDSWSEYSGVNLKIQRYSNMIAALKNLQSFWIALDDSERSNAKSFLKLVELSESVMMQEVRTWFSTFERAQLADDGEHEQKETN